MRTWLLVTVSAVVLAGCSPGTTTHATIDVDRPVALADQAVHLKVSGLRSHETVRIGSQTIDAEGKQWHAEATFDADDHGVVDLDRASPSDGSYQGVDGMGLFWSMNPADGDADQQSYHPPTKDEKPISDIELTVREDGRTLATRTLTRQWLGAGVTTKALTVATDKLAGLLMLPPPDKARHPAVLIFGGSEGGLGVTLVAKLLASHGYPTLAIAYFHDAGLPAVLKNIPLEYFATAARLLAAQPGVDPAHVIALSASRGTEAALLLAQNFPSLVHGAVLYAPSARVNGAFPVYVDGDAWTLGGRSLDSDELIPVDHVSGPVLAIAGDDDQVWPSATSATLIVRELDQAHNRYPHQALVVPHAGHAVAGYPYSPRGTHILHPVVAQVLWLGGTRQANEAAQVQGWSKVLSLLNSL